MSTSTFTIPENFMGNRPVPNEYQKFPAAILYAFLRLMIATFKQEKFKIDSTLTGGLREIHDYKEEDTIVHHVAAIDKDNDQYILKVYHQISSPPNFEKDYGFSTEGYSNNNLLVVILDIKNPNELKVMLDKDRCLVLYTDPSIAVNQTTCPFWTHESLATKFWELYKKIIGQQFSSVH